MEIKVSEIPAYYISLKSQVQMRKQVQGALRSQGFNDLTWVEGARARTKAMGCALGHKNALEYALEKDVFPFLVVEDDVLPYEQYETLTVPNDADALYVGISQWGLHAGVGVHNYAADAVSKDVYRLWNMLAAHAVVYFNREYVEFLLQVNDIFRRMGTNQDKGRAETMKYWNVYGLARPMFYQDGRYEKYTKFEMPSAERRSLDFFYKA
jgi:hypothetical protein